jgi:hypothetical protein
MINMLLTKTRVEAKRYRLTVVKLRVVVYLVLGFHKLWDSVLNDSGLVSAILAFVVVLPIMSSSE